MKKKCPVSLKFNQVTNLLSKFVRFTVNTAKLKPIAQMMLTNHGVCIDNCDFNLTLN